MQFESFDIIALGSKPCHDFIACPICGDTFERCRMAQHYGSSTCRAGAWKLPLRSGHRATPKPVVSKPASPKPAASIPLESAPSFSWRFPAKSEESCPVIQRVVSPSNLCDGRWSYTSVEGFEAFMTAQRRQAQLAQQAQLEQQFSPCACLTFVVREERVLEIAAASGVGILELRL
jgi:hypothetical protein